MLSGILAGQGFESVIGGDESLSRRPMRRIITPLTRMGAHIVGRDGDFPPLRIQGAEVKPIDYELPVASAQVKTSVLFAGLFALGLVMLTAARGIPVNLEDILLGQVLAVSWTDTFVTLGLAGAVLALILGLHKELVFASFDPSGATVIGLPTEKLEYLLLGLLSVVVVLALQAVGVILVISMLITPAATALLLMRNFVQAMTAAVIIGVASAVLGLYLSYYFNMPSGPVMALTATGFFVLAAAWKGRPTWLIQQQRA